MSKPIPTVDELMAEAFAPGRDQRSAEYKAGVRSILERRIHGTPQAFPYKLGSAQADDFLAGQDEGRALWNVLQDDK